MHPSEPMTSRRLVETPTIAAASAVEQIWSSGDLGFIAAQSFANECKISYRKTTSVLLFLAGSRYPRQLNANQLPQGGEKSPHEAPYQAHGN